MTDYIIHYGVKHKSGRYPWGSGNRPYQSSPNVKTKNIEKFRSSPDNNILFITGMSGSGKSTLASNIAKSNDIIIHLDGYSEFWNKSIQNKKFNNYLDKNYPDYKKIVDATDDKKGTLRRFSKEYFDAVDEFKYHLEQFSKQYYTDGAVIVEGVQIANQWLAEKNYFIDKPIIILQTSVKQSSFRASERDQTKIDDMIKWNSKFFNEAMSSFQNDLGIIQKGYGAIENVLMKGTNL